MKNKDQAQDEQFQGKNLFNKIILFVVNYNNSPNNVFCEWVINQYSLQRC